MTDVRAPETDSFEPAAERDDQPRPGPLAEGRVRPRRLAEVGVAAAHLDAGRADLALPAGSGQRAGIDAAAAGRQPGRRPAVLHVASGPRALAEPLGLFNVFAAPWFAAIYCAVRSFVGCVVRRTFRLGGSARTLPPRAPRHLARPAQVRRVHHRVPPRRRSRCGAGVSGRGFRLRRPDNADPEDWVSAEKGYLREAGNLLFHLTLLGVLVSAALGGCSVTRPTGCWYRARASPTP